jgi:hypothetical protein
LTALAKVRCMYTGARRLTATTPFLLTLSRNLAAVLRLNTQILEKSHEIAAQVDGDLKSLDACFSQYFGLDGWYSEYGGDIMKRIDTYADMRLLK